MPYKNPEKQRAYWRKWYRNNPEKAKKYYRRKAKRRREQTKKWYHKHKGTLCCERCGEDESCCLEFHHKDPEEKEHTLSVMTSQGYSKKRILEEMEKCVVLCSNCHKKEHHLDK